MSLLDALRARLTGDRTPPWHRETLDRLTVLEASEAAREAEMIEWKDRMLRTLRRLDGHAAREKQLAEREEDSGYAAAKRTALAMKFPRANGG